MVNNQIFKLEGTQICIICDSDEKKHELGTGFVFLKPNWIVTAAHVVIDEGLPRRNLYVKFPVNGQSNVKVKVVATHKENDIALLEILADSSPCKKPLYPGYDELSTSKGLVCIGYTPSKGNSILTASLAKVYNKEKRERESIETVLEFESIDVEHGSSGAPIFGDGGVILGVLINMFSLEDKPNKRWARATSIKNLMRGISFNITDDTFDLIEK